MSLESLLELIQTKGEEQVNQILQDAEKKAGEILLKARAEAKKARLEKIRSQTDKASLERYRILHSARQYSQQQISETREKFIQRVFQMAGEQLSQARMRDDYPFILEKLIEEAVKEIEDAQEDISKAWMLIDPRDLEFVKSYCSRKSMNITIKPGEQNWGGVILVSHDGRVAVINTLESRYELAKPHLRQTVARFLE